MFEGNLAAAPRPVTIPPVKRQKRIENPQPMAMLNSDGTWSPFTPTTDLGQRLVELHNKQILAGGRSYTSDEVLQALAEDRAGYDGFGRLWGKCE